MRNDHMVAEPLVTQFHVCFDRIVHIPVVPQRVVDVPERSQAQHTDRLGGHSSSDTESGLHLPENSDNSVGATGADD